MSPSWVIKQINSHCVSHMWLASAWRCCCFAQAQQREAGKRFSHPSPNPFVRPFGLFAPSATNKDFGLGLPHSCPRLGPPRKARLGWRALIGWMCPRSCRGKWGTTNRKPHSAAPLQTKIIEGGAARTGEAAVKVPMGNRASSVYP